MHDIDLDAPEPERATALAREIEAWHALRAARLAQPPGADSEAWLAAALQGLRLGLRARDEALATQCLGEALGWAEGMALAAGWGGGQLRIALPQAPALEAPLRRLRPGPWLGALMAAGVARSARSLRRLADMPCLDAPENGSERFSLAAGRAYAALALGEDSAGLALQDALALAQDPGERALVVALADVALERALQPPPLALDPKADEGASALPLERWLACEVLAAWRGGTVSEAARAWLAGLRPVIPPVCCTAPPRRAPLPAEPMWWLDLHAGPGTRTHRLQADAQGRTLARYRVVPPDGGPEVRAEFLLLAPGEVADGAAPPLDVGELVQLSDIQAATVAPGAEADGDELRRRRAALDIALAALDAALARLPAGRAAGAEDFPSPLGRACWETEPGRFSPERLRARRAVLVQWLADVDQQLAGEAAAEAGASPQAMPGAEAGPATAAGPAPALAAEHAAPPAQPREQALRWLALIRQLVEPVLDALGQGDAALAAQLQPCPEDYARAFVPGVAEAARAAYAAVWAQQPPLPAAAPGSRLVTQLAPAGMLGDDNELSRAFPGGYRAIAPLLEPHRVWVAWKLIPPGRDAGLAYDGLVWLDDHWAWFPKPYRVLAHLAQAQPPAR